RVNPANLLKEMSGDQRYILDYLIEEVLSRQPQEIQTFLLSTCMLKRLTASLCDAVMQQTDSQQMLGQLEHANLFVVALDSKRQWYRYHALFAEALYTQLEKTQPDLVLILHHRASLWYTQHDQTTEAILHAFKAREWHWAADLIEQAYPPLVSFTWGVGRHMLVQFQQWIGQLPADILACRPHLCLACVHLLWTITPHALLFTWLDMAEATVRASLKEQTLASVSQRNFSPQAQQEQMDLLGKILTYRAYLWSYLADGQAAFALHEQALALLSPENAAFRAIAAIGKSIAYYSSSANNAMATIESGYQAALLTQEAKQPAVTFAMRAWTAIYLIGAGHLHETEQLTRQTIQLETPSDNPQLPWIGWVTLSRAEILREWNELADAQPLAAEAISLCEQAISLVSLPYLYWGHAVMIRVCLSCGDIDAARTFLWQAEQIGRSMNQQVYLYLHSCFTTVDQVRLWLACGDLDRARCWAEERDLAERRGFPFVHEREEVACARVLLAQAKSHGTLQRLEPILQRATAGQRWGHVIEIRLLQALAYQMHQQETQALDALSEAVRLAEPEGYIRSFVEEGAPMESLLYPLRKRNRKQGPTPYLDTLLAAFQQESKTHVPVGEHTKAQPLPEPLSERELQVLQLIEQGLSNQEIAQELVIAYDTVKRHVSHIFSKLAVNNRVQAVRQAQTLGLLDMDRSL
ncbi:MAG TPA: LuxR C-terminal-related transcriptional regulator, partial [Ktedonobacteraceae bacterium]|nr:LuxR C-terminal-related transcriptional regulator [Ktedonobacteraceae bacterium]